MKGSGPSNGKILSKGHGGGGVGGNFDSIMQGISGDTEGRHSFLDQE